MDAPCHWFGDGCPAPHGSPDAPMRWANHPDEPIWLVRRRYGVAAGPPSDVSAATLNSGLRVERRRTPATVGGQL